MFEEQIDRDKNETGEYKRDGTYEGQLTKVATVYRKVDEDQKQPSG